MVNWMHAGEALCISDNSLSWKDQSRLCTVNVISMLTLPSMMSMPTLHIRHWHQAWVATASPAGNGLHLRAPAQPASQQQALLGCHADCCPPHLAPALQSGPPAAKFPPITTLNTIKLRWKPCMQRHSSSGGLSCRPFYACEGSSERPCSTMYTASTDALVVKPSSRLPESILGFASRQMDLYVMDIYCWYSK